MPRAREAFCSHRSLRRGKRTTRFEGRFRSRPTLEEKRLKILKKKIINDVCLAHRGTINSSAGNVGENERLKKIYRIGKQLKIRNKED